MSRKGSPEASLAGVRAAISRKFNAEQRKIYGENWKPQKGFKGWEIDWKEEEKPKRGRPNKIKKQVEVDIPVINLELDKLKDTEAFVFVTNGPTRITYSAKYNKMLISPHHIQLKEKK